MRLPAVILVALTLSALNEIDTVEARNRPTLVLAQAERPLVSGERVRAQRLLREIESSMQTLDQGGVAPFQDPAHVQRWNDTVQRYETALARFPTRNDVDVQAAMAKLAELEAMIAFGVSQGGAQSDQLGDVQSVLAGMERDLRANRAPQWLPAPFSVQEAAAFTEMAVKAKQTAERSLGSLQEIASNAHLPVNPGTVEQGAPYDSQDVNRLQRFAQSIVADVNEALSETLSRLQSQFEAQQSELQYFRDLDPDNESHRMNAFLQQGAEERIYGQLDRHLAFAESVAIYQRAFGREPSEGTQQRIAEIRALRERYSENRRLAVGESRLPEPQSNDASRLGIARQILAEPSYEFGRHGPVVLTTEAIVNREEQVSRAQIRDVDVSLSGEVTLSGTQETWNYRWEEFKFVTPIKEDDSDEWYLWWITAKNYSSGASSTPLGRWVSGAATKGDLIPRENFD